MCAGQLHRGGVGLRAGDVGRLDSSGYLYIMDRLKDIIIRSTADREELRATLGADIHLVREL